VNGPTDRAPPLPPPHLAFLAALPRIVLHGRVSFLHVASAEAREEAIAEMVALSWSWFVRLARRGKDPTGFVSAIATFAARAVRSGRKLCGQERAKDVFSARARRAGGFAVLPLPDVSTPHGNPYEEALVDNTRTPVPDQVSFRLDFPAWRLTRSRRDRDVIDDLMLGEPTSGVARRHGLSAARVSQLRRELHDDWQRFCDGARAGGAGGRDNANA